MIILGFIAVGLIALAAGFVAGKVYTEKSLNAADLQKQVDDTQQQMDKYREDVSANLAVTQNLMSEMKNNYDNIVAQMDRTTKLLEQPRFNDPNMQYYGHEAAAELFKGQDALADTKRKKHQEVQSQPSDYSDGASGLFDNQPASKQIETHHE
jgi:uncharacterized membrane-anchored protein YhcB (DUF1043 family)